MNKIGKRISLIPKDDGFEGHIATPKNKFMLGFLPIWLTGWTIGGIVALFILISGKGEDGSWFLMIWLCFWAYAECFTVYAFLWNAWGKEIISVQKGTLEIFRSIFGYGKRKAYNLGEISNLRASGFFGNMFSKEYGMAQWGLAGGTIAFDYKYKTLRFGIGLEERDALELVENMKNYL
jgi:hypothetical protein